MFISAEDATGEFDSSLVGKCGRAIQTLSRYIASTPTTRDLLEGWQSTVQFNLIGEDPFHLTISENGAEFHEGKAENPDVELSGRSEVFFEVITGDLNADEAYMMKQYTIKGSVVDAMKFRRISELTEQEHKTMFSVLKTFGKVAFR